MTPSPADFTIKNICFMSTTTRAANEVDNLPSNVTTPKQGGKKQLHGRPSKIIIDLVQQLSCRWENL